MDHQSAPAVPGRVEQTKVAVWGVSACSSALAWGRPDPRRDPLTVDRYSGVGRWGRHCYSTDFWLRW